MNLKNIYTVETEKIPSKPGCWDVLNCKIYRTTNDTKEQIGEYKRNYSQLFDTFFPFILNNKHLALYSPSYTSTRILSLPDCIDIGGEEPKSNGFCPVNYYIPYYFQYEYENNIKFKLYDPSSADDLQAKEITEHGYTNFGFIAGCHWGDDTSWKIQFLDLSKADQGILTRDDRFGYIEMPENINNLKDCINLSSYDEFEECDYVKIAIQKTFHITGEPIAL